MNPLFFILACTSAVAIFSTNLLGYVDNFPTGRWGRIPADAEKKSSPVFERVLVLMDLPACEARTAEIITHIPGVSEAILLDILDTSVASANINLMRYTQRSSADNAEMRLAAQKNYLENLGTPSRILLEPSKNSGVLETLTEVACRENASLVVIRSEPRSRLFSALFENEAIRVLRSCTQRDMLICPVMTRERLAATFPDPWEKNMFAKILCPTDLSPLGLETIAWAAGFETVSEIVLLYVRPPGLRWTAGRIDPWEILDGMSSRIARKNLKITTVIREGDPAREIGLAAEDRNVSLILMPRCGLARHLSGAGLGGTVAAVANRLTLPLLARMPRYKPEIQSHELRTEEFCLAEDLWTHYRHQKVDGKNDRVFGTYLDDTLVSVAWCKRHPDGLEVEGTFTLEEYRRHGFARKAIGTLIAACGNEPLFMHSTLELVEFFKSVGFVPIPENELPPTIQAQFAFALGNLEGANACPMRREPAPLPLNRADPVLEDRSSDLETPNDAIHTEPICDKD